MPAAAPKYNPGFLTDDELVTSFCVRGAEFESVMETLRDCTGPSNAHQIVVGPRGSGKTTLLLRVAAEVRRDTVLSGDFFPIQFAEESYEVGTAGEFWLECLSRLADQAPKRDGDPDLDLTVAELRSVREDRDLATRCLGALLDFADREGKRLVLLVENLNMMFREMTDPDAGSRLREVLRHEPRIVVLGSATARFSQITDPAEALYKQFRIVNLEPLDTEACRVLWESVSGRSAAQHSIRSLEILTGGSPRLLAVVARFGSARSFRALLAELLDLVDDHTEYFKSHLEALPPQERRVYLALAELWKPATTREIARRCRLDTSKCSAQLKRLMERDVVQQKGGTARRKEYYLTERLYNIYYLLRRRGGHAPLVEALVRFMRACYAAKELAAISMQMRRELDELDTRMRAMYRTALEQLASEEGGSRAEAVALFNRGVHLLNEGQAEKAVSIWDDLIRQVGDTQDPPLRELVCAALVERAGTLGTLNRPAEALAVSDEFRDRVGDRDEPALRKHVARALINRGAALARLDRLQEAMEAWDEVEHRFKDSEDPDVQEAVGIALVNTADGLSKLDRQANAIAVLDTVGRWFGASEHSAVLRQVAIALVNKGVALLGREQPEGAVTAWQEVVRRFGRSEDIGLRGQVAKALVNQGVAFAELQRTEEALSAWADVERRYGADEAQELLDSVVTAVGNRGQMLNGMGRPEETIAACDRMLDRLGNNEALRARTLRVLVLKGSALKQLDREQDALAAYEEVTRRLEESESPPLQHWKHQALLEKADIQLKGGQYAAVIETVGLALEDGHAKPPEVRWRAHAIRAHAALLKPDLAATVRDLEELLVILAEWDSPPREAVQSLLILTVGIGPEPMIRLIEDSPAKDFLLPFTTALAWELGRRPRVALEVEEVAKDLRSDLAELRGNASAPGA